MSTEKNVDIFLKNTFLSVDKHGYPCYNCIRS
nr:MAG TPA: HS1 knob domain-roll topology, viral protein, Cell [Caudoviricetes sp.]